MSDSHRDRVKKLKADFEAAHSSIEAELDQLRQKWDELQQKRDELRELIEGLNVVLSGSGANSHRVAEVVGNGSASSQESTPTTNGLPENPTRREVVLKILPSFHGERFKSGDVRHRFVQDYLGGVEPPNFPQAINNLLKRMAKKGEITDLGRDEDEPGAPRYYRENKSQEETLNLGP
jgi:hypothetical protein